MKRFLVVGLGNFGTAVASELYSAGSEVIALDANAEKVDRMAAHVTRAVVGDGRQIDILERIGAKHVDVAVVSTGDDITSSILTVMALRDLGQKTIYVKVVSPEHARVMRKLGVEETIFPERDTARWLATRLRNPDSLLSYTRLSSRFSIQEMVVPNAWTGKTLRELDIRKHFDVNVIAVHDVLTDNIDAAPDPDAVLKDSDTVFLGGGDEGLARVAQLE